MIDLEDIFGAETARAGRSPASGPAERPDVTSPATTGDVTPTEHQTALFGPETGEAQDGLPGARFEGWGRRQDAWGRGGWEPPGLPETDRWAPACDFEDLPEPGAPCPGCGCLTFWEDVTGGRHCMECEAPRLARADALAARAADLRRQAELDSAGPAPVRPAQLVL